MAVPSETETDELDVANVPDEKPFDASLTDDDYIASHDPQLSQPGFIANHSKEIEVDKWRDLALDLQQEKNKDARIIAALKE